MVELVAVTVCLLLYWLVFGHPRTIYNTPFGMPLQLLLEWTATQPPHDIAEYHPIAAFLLSVVLVLLPIYAVEAFL